MTTYCWKAKTPFRIDAQAAGETLRSLAQGLGGRMTARVVLDEARAETSPLHRAFEWDDLRAAEKFREGQARLMLHSISIAPSRTGIDDALPIFVQHEERVGGGVQKVFVSVVDQQREPMDVTGQIPLSHGLGVDPDRVKRGMAAASRRPAAHAPRLAPDIVVRAFNEIGSLERRYRDCEPIATILAETKARISALRAIDAFVDVKA